MEFCGHYKTSVDQKWRLKIPAEYRGHLLQTYGDAFFITSADLESLLVYPMPVWEVMMKESQSNPDLAEKMADLNMCGRISKMDAQGKVMISEYMRLKSPALKGAVIAAAVVDHLEIYSLAMAEKTLEENKISNRGMARIRAKGHAPSS
jgi:DNA-binding transcriptional regulator/RsmH inhibitor MraZ